MYGLECAELTEEADAELCDEVPQDHSRHIFVKGEEKYNNLQVGQAAKDIICTREEETLLSSTHGMHEG